MIRFLETGDSGKGNRKPLMSKVAEWLIAILLAILLGYLLIDQVGLPVWLGGAIGLGLIGLGLIVGHKRKL